jgi:hypothetical protein
MTKTQGELKTDLNLSLSFVAAYRHQTPALPFHTHLHSPRWEAGADHMASSPVASDVGREVLGSGLGGVQHGQEHELLRGRKGTDKNSRNRA